MKKTVLITGASRGIGRAAAHRFAAAGFTVIANYKSNEHAAEEVRQELDGMGADCMFIRADVSRPEEVHAMTERIYSECGGVDVLVNNAGVALPQGLFTDFSDKDCRMIFDTDVMGVMNCCRELVPHFVKVHRGKIINISSVWGVRGGSCEVIYSAAKAAVIGFTRALAAELAPSGINVNCVAPGMIDTDMNAHLSEEDMKSFAEEVPLQRIGKPSEIAETVFFLASDAASYITGQVLTVDGGFTV